MSKQVFLYLFKMSKKSFKAEEILTLKELARYQAMQSEKRKLEFISARHVLRQVLEQYHNISDPEISETKNGKPISKKIKFNLSHSKDYVVVAVSKKTELGADVESPKTRQQYKEIAQNYFSPVEYKYIFSKAKNQTQRFTLLWSLKESYFKAFDNSLSKKNTKIYFDLVNKKVESLPSKKKVSFLYSEKLNLSVCAIGALRKSDFKAYEIGLKKEKLVKKALSTSLFEVLKN